MQLLHWRTAKSSSCGEHRMVGSGSSPLLLPGPLALMGSIHQRHPDPAPPLPRRHASLTTAAGACGLACCAAGGSPRRTALLTSCFGTSQTSWCAAQAALGNGGALALGSGSSSRARPRAAPPLTRRRRRPAHPATLSVRQYWCCASEGGKDTSVFWYHLPPGFNDEQPGAGADADAAWRAPVMELPAFCDDPELTKEEKQVTAVGLGRAGRGWEGVGWWRGGSRLFALHHRDPDALPPSAAPPPATTATQVIAFANHPCQFLRNATAAAIAGALS